MSLMNECMNIKIIKSLNEFTNSLFVFGVDLYWVFFFINIACIILLYVFISRQWAYRRSFR